MHIYVTEKMLHRFGIVLGIATGVLVLAVFQPRVDHDVEVAKQHCSMVKLWNDTSGEYGWPDYNNSAHGCGKYE
jgi:hypothetical protein